MILESGLELDAHQATAANACHDTSQDHNVLVLRQAADEIAGRKEKIADHETRSATKDVGQSARDRLEGGIGDEVSRRQPGQQAEGVKLAGDGTRERGDDGRVNCAKKRAEPDGDHDDGQLSE